MAVEVFLKKEGHAIAILFFLNPNVKGRFTFCYFLNSARWLFRIGRQSIAFWKVNIIKLLFFVQYAECGPKKAIRNSHCGMWDPNYAMWNPQSSMRIPHQMVRNRSFRCGIRNRWCGIPHSEKAWTGLNFQKESCDFQFLFSKSSSCDLSNRHILKIGEGCNYIFNKYAFEKEWPKSNRISSLCLRNSGVQGKHLCRKEIQRRNMHKIKLNKMQT